MMENTVKRKRRSSSAWASSGSALNRASTITRRPFSLFNVFSGRRTRTWDHEGTETGNK
jgi:hypothetical protein